jgi:hypothetical protein
MSSCTDALMVAILLVAAPADAHPGHVGFRTATPPPGAFAGPPRPQTPVPPPPLIRDSGAPSEGILLELGGGFLAGAALAAAGLALRRQRATE